MNNQNFNFETTFKLAIENHKKNNFKEASNHYEKILDANSENFDANFYFGTLNLQTENFIKASKLLNKAIEIKPNITEAHNNLGIAYDNLEKIDKAEICFNKSIEINPNYVEAYLNLGKLYTKTGEIEKSEKFYNNAISINPKYFNAYNNLMNLFEKTNQNEKLKKIIILAEEQFRNHAVVKLFYGFYLFKTQNFLDAIKKLEEIKFDESEFNREILRSFVLARCYDQIDNTEKAFFYFKKRNELDLKYKSNDIDKNKARKIVNDRINFFKENDINKWSLLKPNNKDENPIFLIGFQRSGTTLLDNILRSHKSIEVLEEKPIVGNFVTSIDQKMNSNFSNLKNINEENLNEFRKIYFDFREKYISKKDNSKIYIDKMPLNIIHVGEIVRIFPNAKFIVTLRHPCDCVLSCFKQNFKLNNANANFLNLKDSANFYNSVMSLWEQYTNVFKVNHHIIKYEDIVLDFEKSVQKVLEFLELPWSNSVLEFYKNAQNRKRISSASYDQVIKPIYSKSVNNWTKYKKEISEIIPLLKYWTNKFNY